VYICKFIYIHIYLYIYLSISPSMRSSALVLSDLPKPWGDKEKRAQCPGHAEGGQAIYIYVYMYMHIYTYLSI